MMEMEMRKFLDKELPSHIIAAIGTMCKEFSDVKSSSDVTLSHMLSDTGPGLTYKTFFSEFLH